MGRKTKKTKRKAEPEQSSRPSAARRDEDGRTTGSSPRSAPRLTSMVPVRFEPRMLEEIRRRADQDGRSVSAWIRRAVESELRRGVNA
jgi:hypothetical protein